MPDAFQPPLGSRAERIAYNESWSRSLNESRAGWMGAGETTAGFRCECGNALCEELIELTAEEWELARARRNRFVVAPGHVVEDVEAVVEQHTRFWFVEKLGDAGRIAERLA